MNSSYTPIPLPENNPEENWTAGRSSGLAFDQLTLQRLGYQVMDEVASYLSGIRECPVWQPMPTVVRRAIGEQELPEEGQPFEETLALIHDLILPFSQGNGHPCFAGWINSAPAHAGILVKPLADAMNPNCGIGDHAGQELERRVVQWIMELCGFPVEGSAGVFVSGGTDANFTCLQAARYWAAQADGWDIRAKGLQGQYPPFVLYKSDQCHFCIQKAAEAMGLGSDSLRTIPTTSTFQMRLDLLRQQIQADRDAGLRPFCVVGTAGTVNTGAIDPLDELADLCAEQELWFHVDGAYGAFGILDPEVEPLYRGIERADSLATDQHKWLSVAIDCGCALVRDSAVLRDTFSVVPPALRNDDDELWLSDYTLQRTRRFRALEVWAILRSAGRDGLTEAIAKNNAQARLLASLIEAESDLELIASGPLSIVRFRYAPPALRDEPLLLDQMNKAITQEVQQRGKAFVTCTRFEGKEVLRACMVNHLTTDADVHIIVDEIINAGRDIVSGYIERKAKIHAL